MIFEFVDIDDKEEMIFEGKVKLSKEILLLLSRFLSKIQKY